MTAAVAAPARSGSSGPLTGTGVLLRFALRLDRLRLAIWVLGVGGITVYSVVGLDAVYPTAADRLGRAAVITSPAGVLLSGPGYGTADYTLGAMIANELSLSVMVAVAIMSIQLVVRHTRAEEESGRAELVRAGVVGRRAALTAALLTATLADAAIVAVVAAGLAASGLAVPDSVALAAGIGLTGLLFGAVAAVTSQLTEHTRAASGIALAVLALAGVVRGVGDLISPHGSALSWFSPIAWTQQTRAFVDLRWGPLLLSVALLLLLVLIGYRLVGRRDVGAGMVAPRPGPARAAPSLSTVAALTLRLGRAGILAWTIGLLLTGMVFGSLADQVAGMVAGNSRLAALLTVAGRDITDGFFAATALDVGVLAAAFAVGSVLRMRAEEAAGRVEAVLAAAVDRRTYLGSSVAVTAAAAALMLLAGGLGTGVTSAAVSGDAGMVTTQLTAQLLQLPAVLVLAGAAGALVAWVPRLAALAWVPVTWAVVGGFFGPLLRLPAWALKLSPFSWLPAFPAEPFGVLPVAALTLLAAVLVALALAGFRRRDVPA